MTPKEQSILDFIRQFVKKHRYSPTIAEIARAIKVGSRGTVYRYLQQLQEEGHLILNAGKQRNIELTNQGWCDKSEGFSLPILGKIAAGRPIEAILDKTYLDVTRLVGDDRYVLKVCGDSMVDEGIYDGDLVICRHAKDANNGEIVVALVDNEFATLKRFYRKEKTKIVLKPENPKFDAITYAADRITIQGIFIGLLRFPY